ncbi:MAG TPA: hypothetical protein VKV20_06160 [Ktedonobacteraceae bacterium]|jgi:hypothetical protein|nr:hypothetical protein [Ktedonobacteraceae bacterium]
MKTNVLINRNFALLWFSFLGSLLAILLIKAPVAARSALPGKCPLFL